MRALKVSAIVFTIVAAIGFAVILGRFVFKLGPAQISMEPQISAQNSGELGVNEVTSQELDPALMIPPSPVVEAPKPAPKTAKPNDAALEAMASSQAASNCTINVSKPIAINDWSNPGKVIATSDGGDCESAIVRIELIAKDGKSLFTMSSPARDFGLGAGANANNMRKALNAALPNSAVRANAYPQWVNDNDKPFGTEFDKATYEKIRSAQAPVICLKLPKAPQTCIAANPDNGELRTFSRG